MNLMMLSLGLLIAGYIHASEVNQLEGQWKGNGKKTAEARIKSGNLKNESIVNRLIPILSDETYIFTNNTFKISSISRNSTSAAIPYEIIKKNNSSVTISYQKENSKHNQVTFHFSDDGNCIYIERGKYNDYFCKKI